LIGTTISHYKILEKLGGGGMGVVYKAHDTKLDRDVALKFLPPELTLDPEAKGRFIHEAKAASALQHNNICTIHDIDQTADGQMFIVMDLYEGETLKSRITRGRLKIEEATDIAIQIAQGLGEAHQHGIVHRDVKPANILITKNGVVKIVDFGLAKLSGGTKMTKTGSTLGTVAYMAPEQLQGSDVDARADIFSVGVVLYEMVTGKTPFHGDHEAALMYSIMNEEPEPLQTHIPDVTSELIHVVGRALEKDPASRYKTMDDLLIDLRRVRKETSKVYMPAFGTKKRPLIRSRLVLAVASVAGLAVVAIVAFYLNQPRKLPRVNPDLKASVVPLNVKDVAYCSLSRDGNWIAFGGQDGNGKWDIYYMNSSGGAVRRVTQDSSAMASARDCSSDGAWILYARRTGNRFEIAAVPTLGGAVRVITGGLLPQFLPMSDRILYIRGGWTGVPSKSGKFELWSIKIDGSDDRFVFVDPGYSDESGSLSFSYSVSPNGKAIAWIKTFADFSQDIITHNLETGNETQVTFSRTAKDEVSWTRDNYLIYSAYASGNYDLWMCAAEGGAQQQLTRSRNDEMYGELSDGGAKLLYYEASHTGNIRMMNLETGRVTSITSDDRNRAALCVSPDMRYVACTNVASTVDPATSYWFTWQGIEVVDLNGEYPTRTISTGERIAGIKSWSPGGTWIAYARLPDSVDGTTKICIVDPFAGTRSKVVAETKERAVGSLNVRWVSPDTLSWFSGMKTWICSINNSQPVQLYEDSTSAYVIQGGKYVLFRDYRAGRQGWWVDASPMSAIRSAGGARRVLDPVSTTIAPSGDFLLYSPRAGELRRLSLPDGKSSRVPYSLPPLSHWRGISQDGKKMVYVEQAINSKLMLWQNPFIWE
jgi:serine/threonine protein kinase/Tol biopolymer transport system component